MFANLFPRPLLAACAEAQAARLGPSAHVDTFTRDNLPASADWPDLLDAERRWGLPRASKGV